MYSENNLRDSIDKSLESAKKWIKYNTIDRGIAHSSSIRKPYPEVTGYYIPSLLKLGDIERAKLYGDWLLSIQTKEGAWQELELKTIYTFDTGQILKGLYALIPYGEQYEKAFLKGCDWLLRQIDGDGRIHTPITSHFSSVGNEYIHLYALEPLKRAAKKYKREDYHDAVKKAEKYYLSQSNLTDFSILSHFHAYIVEALIDLGYQEKAIESLSFLNEYKNKDGVFTAFHNVKWVCLTAILQYAVCYFKLGFYEEGKYFLNYAIHKQNKSGGFFGGYGWFVTYFKNVEISWPVKYLLDAIYLYKKISFKDGGSILRGDTDCSQSYVEHYLASHEAQVTRQYKMDYLPELMMDALAISPNNHSVIYVGCGTAGFIKDFNRTSRFVGIDYSKNMLDAAKKNSLRIQSQKKMHTEWFEGKFEDYCSDEKFDVICLMVYGPYVPLTQDVLKKAKTLLKEDGTLFIPVVKHNMSFIGKIKHMTKHIITRRNFMYDAEASTKSILRSCKFKIQTIIDSSSSYCNMYILKNA